MLAVRSDPPFAHIVRQRWTGRLAARAWLPERWNDDEMFYGCGRMRLRIALRQSADRCRVGLCFFALAEGATDSVDDPYTGPGCEVMASLSDSAGGRLVFRDRVDLVDVLDRSWSLVEALATTLRRLA